MTEERQPNTELREACGKEFETICNLPEGHKGQCGWEPASIQAEAQQQIEKLKEELARVYKIVKHWHESAEAAEKQLAEARAQAFREAAEIARNHTAPRNMANVCEAIAAALERAAEEKR